VRRGPQPGSASKPQPAAACGTEGGWPRPAGAAKHGCYEEAGRVYGGCDCCDCCCANGVPL
jgi:hypothetical protein